MNQDLSIVTLVLHASLIVQIVMAGLLIVSLASWSAIFAKMVALRKVRAGNDDFERELRAELALMSPISPAEPGVLTSAAARAILDATDL